MYRGNTPYRQIAAGRCWYYRLGLSVAACYMTSMKYSGHGFPIACLKDCLLPLTSLGICTRSAGGGGKL